MVADINQLYRELFIGSRYSLGHCKANINRFPMHPRISL